MAKRKLVPASQPLPFNPKAHPIVLKLIDAAEVWAIRNGECEAHNAEEWLTCQYLLCSDSVLARSQCFLESEGRIAADIFLYQLSKCAPSKVVMDYRRNEHICAMQLHWHTQSYFRNFDAALQQAYIRVLHSSETLQQIDDSGIIKLAVRYFAANDVRAEINRERRRRGATSDRLMMPQSQIEVAKVHFSQSPNLIVNINAEQLTL
ncbi:hypothetical protein [Novosphingobium mangrovi (ex Hu et al. 2023)]|uniref:Uncharacterized protein n=1 Tax=Novosphingobium mangrovi (ex Hu et al. 2023) TaxID=2930094 RepID=A0ABT0A9R2_9SPHN|nr:hypothetical protein [Novosphingobium mangrovi (ex Hu et al. 2023)]MCJ1959894.1 hypothetical protein [Novosphingobium mangrovi (ex Hu et al. 2023)]